MPVEEPTPEQRERYKAAYRAYCEASRALVAARAEWLPETPPMPESALVGSQFITNMRIAEALRDEVRAQHGRDGGHGLE